MPDIRIHRAHRLGLPRAREVAWQWAEEVERKFDMACTVIEGDTSDTVEFARPGVKGQLLVAAHRFELEASLGFLLGAFSRTIEDEIERNLDELLAAEKRKAAAARASARGPAAPARPSAPAAAAKKATAARKSPARKKAAPG